MQVTHSKMKCRNISTNESPIAQRKLRCQIIKSGREHLRIRDIASRKPDKASQCSSESHGGGLVGSTTNTDMSELSLLSLNSRSSRKRRCNQGGLESTQAFHGLRKRVESDNLILRCKKITENKRDKKERAKEVKGTWL